MSTFEQAIDVIINHEAYQHPDGHWDYYVNDPDDKGGPTAWGISTLIIETHGIAPEFLKIPDLSAESIELITLDTAKTVYRTVFWDAHKYSDITDQTAATKIFDANVNMLSGGIMCCQRACISLGYPVTVDGLMGPNTLTAINSCDPSNWVKQVCKEMAKHYQNIIAAKPKQKKFERTWMRRAAWPKSRMVDWDAPS